MEIKLIRKMKPFYLEPLPSTDSTPKIEKLILPRLWSQKPSFLMIYFLINNKILSKDCAVKGGPNGPTYVEWQFFDDRIVWYSDLIASKPKEHIWYLGIDYNLKIADNIDKFKRYIRRPICNKCPTGNRQGIGIWTN